ncbi:hypothetical protein U1763_17440 [Sphingomonas sp. LB2R24]|uniref:DUF6950 family protein n=1 Tax=Sphingomonas sorbitolis TaxID=3096165 RepID=UPI002FC7CC52
MIEMIRRQQAAQAAVDRFKGEPWELGKNDCVRMAAFVLRKMGHRPQLGKAGSYKTGAGSLLALKRAGYDTLAGALDGLGLERVAPAAARVADIVMIPGEGPLDGALTIAVGNGRVLGYHEDLVGADILQPVQFIAAWRL